MPLDPAVAIPQKQGPRSFLNFLFRTADKGNGMNRREMNKNLSCGDWGSARKDWVSADFVERGIELQTDMGYEEAFNYLQKHNIAPDVIERVLSDRLNRRSQLSGAL